MAMCSRFHMWFHGWVSFFVFHGGGVHVIFMFPFFSMFNVGFAWGGHECCSVLIFNCGVHCFVCFHMYGHECVSCVYNC